MHLFIAWTGDFVAQDMQRASLSDDSGEIRRLSQRLDQGAEIWKAWLLRTGGDIIFASGMDGRAQIVAEHLDELNSIRVQYGECIGRKASVGVGIKLSCATKALEAARRSGGDQVLFYTPETEKLLEDETENKYADDMYSEGETPVTELHKATEMSSPALLSGGGNAGMSGAQRAVPPSKPAAEASEHSQGEAMRATAENAPRAPEMTHAASDLEDRLHQHAEATEDADKKAADDEKAQNSQTDAVKKQVFDILEQVKKQGPVLEQIKQQAPEIYKTIMDMVKAVIAMAREMKPKKDEQAKQAAMRKSEDSLEPLSKSIRHIPPGMPLGPKSLPPKAKAALMAPSLAWMNGRDWAHYNYTHALPQDARDQGYHMVVSMHPDTSEGVHLLATLLHEKGQAVGGVSGMLQFDERKNKPVLRIKVSDVESAHRGKGLGKAAYEALMAHSLHKAKVRTMVGGPHSTSASAVHQSLAAKHGFNYKPTPNKNVDQSGPGAEFDDKFAPYSYDFGKQELPKVEPQPEEGIPPKKTLQKSDDQYDPKELEMGIVVEMEHTTDKEKAKQIAKEHLDETPDYYSRLHAAGLAKKQLPSVKPPPTHHNLELPVGSQIDSSSGGRRSPNGQVKIDEGGGEKWREVRAGMKLSSKGQPISALETAKRD